MQALPDALKGAAYAPTAKEYYKLGNEGITCMNAGGKVLEEIPVSLDVPRFSWPMGIAYNTKTNQVAVTSLGGEGFLYHYNPKTKKWTAASQNNQDYQNLNYDSVTGNYVASGSFGRVGINFLSPGGGQVDEFSIDPRKFPGIMDFSDTGNGHHPAFEIIPTEKYFVILLSTGEPMARTSSSAQRVYLYDRKTKDVMLTYALDATTPHRGGGV